MTWLTQCFPTEVVPNTAHKGSGAITSNAGAISVQVRAGFLLLHSAGFIAYGWSAKYSRRRRLSSCKASFQSIVGWQEAHAAPQGFGHVPPYLGGQRRSIPAHHAAFCGLIGKSFCKFLPVAFAA